jgi:hypothetical protein
LPLAALMVGTAIGLLLIARWRDPRAAKTAFAAEAAAPKALAPLQDWGQPDLVLVLSGQEHGYMQPCGCSRPQLGGLTRRYNLIKMLEKRGWDVVSLDLGDVAPKGGFQTMLKYTTSMKALKLMDVSAVGIGENEMALPLLNALGEYALNNPSPRVLAANLRGIEKDGIFHGMVEPFEVAVRGRKKVGIIGAVGPSVAKRVREHVKDEDVKFNPVPRILPQMIKDIRAKENPDLLVLLYQGSETEARACATALPNFDVILRLHSDPEPPSVPMVVGNTSIIAVGHKGRYVGVVGAFRDGKKYTLKYQLVPLGEEFETPVGRQKNHPIMKLMEDYAQDVKNKHYLAEAAARKVAHPVQLAFPKSAFVGSEACNECHKAEFKKWEDSPHARAYQSLVNAKNPSLRQFDPDCVRCHVTGWDYKTGFTSAAKSGHLLNNGCENCHGPAGLHVAMEKAPTAENKKDRRKIRDLMNPFRFDPQEKPTARKRRLDLLDQSCQQCHDIDNDVKWERIKWNRIVHSGDEIKAGE